MENKPANEGFALGGMISHVTPRVLSEGQGDETSL